jgi:hypothetical protein
MPTAFNRNRWPGRDFRRKGGQPETLYRPGPAGSPRPADADLLNLAVKYHSVAFVERGI